MQYLKHYRVARKLTQQDMADLLNISRVTYARYESGVREPDIATMIRIGAILGVLIDQLVGAVEPDADYSSDLYHRVRSGDLPARRGDLPAGLVGMYGNPNFFFLSAAGQEKVAAYIDDLYGNPAYADDVGHVVLRDPATGKIILATVAADPAPSGLAAVADALEAAAGEDTPDFEQKNKA